MQSLSDLTIEIQAEFADFKISPKSGSRWMKFVGSLLTVLSLGKSKDFMQHYITTIGHTVFTSERWDDMTDESKIIVLRHERVHMRQQRKYGRFLFSFLYLVPVFPVFLAYWRAKFEKEAYMESIRAELEIRGTGRVWSPEYQNWLASQFTGPAYLYMWPFKNAIHGWVRDTIEAEVDKFVGLKPKK